MRTGLVLGICWLAAMAWLVQHDIWPSLTAGEAPTTVLSPNDASQRTFVQMGLFDQHQRRIGTAWTEFSPRAGSPTIIRQDTVHLRPFAPLNQEVLLEIDSTFADGQTLDEFEFVLLGIEPTIIIKGERFGEVYGFTLSAGQLVQETFKINAADVGSLGDLAGRSPLCPTCRSARAGGCR